MLKKKLYISIIFAAVILAAQFTTAVSADNTQPPVEKIKLTDTEIQVLNEKINNFTDPAMRDGLREILDREVNENGEISFSGLQEIINVLNNYNPWNDDGIYDLVDLAKAIVEIIIQHLFEIPLYVLALILEDIADLFYHVSQVVDDIRLIYGSPILMMIPGIYLLIQDMNTLIEDLKQIPNDVNETKEYLKEKVKIAVKLVIKDTIEDTAQIVYSFVRPRLGYVANFAESIYNTCITSEDFINDATTKIERVKTIFIDLPKAYLDFKNNPTKDTLVTFGNALYLAWIDIKAWYADATDGETEILNEITTIYNNINYLYNYYNQEPWNKPIKVKGSVINAPGENVIISFENENQTDSYTIEGSEGNFILEFNTTLDPPAEGLHTFTIVITSGSKTLEFERKAFSDGIVEMGTIDFNEGKDKFARPAVSKLLEILSNLGLIFEKIKAFIQTILTEHRASSV